MRPVNILSLMAREGAIFYKHRLERYFPVKLMVTENVMFAVNLISNVRLR